MGRGAGRSGALVTRRFRIVLSTACALLAVMLFVTYANHVRGEAERIRSEAIARYGGEVVELAVASETLEPGDVATHSNVSMREWLLDLAPEGALTSLDDVYGLEVGAPIAKGTPLTQLAFRSTSEVAEVPEGCVAVTIPITDKLGVPRSITVGASLVAYEVGSSDTRLISEGMTVLAIPGLASQYTTGAQITVSVPAEDAPVVLAAAATNDLRLVMPAKDVEAVDAHGASEAPEELSAEDVAAESLDAKGTSGSGGTTKADTAADASTKADEAMEPGDKRATEGEASDGEDDGSTESAGDADE